MCSLVVTFLPNLQNILCSIPRTTREEKGGKGGEKKEFKNGEEEGEREEEEEWEERREAVDFCLSVLLEIVSLGC